MSVRRLLALGLVAAVVGPMPAEAAPFVGRLRTATTTVRIAGTDGKTYQVTVVLESDEPQGGTPVRRLKLDLATCTSPSACSLPKRYAVPIGPADATYAEDMSAASVKTRFGGLPLEVSWRGTPAGSSTGNVAGHISVDNNSVKASESGGGSGGMSAIVLGVKCLGSGEMVGDHTVATEYSPSNSGQRPPSTPPSGFRPARGRTARCL